MSRRSKVVGVVLAAGEGTRMGGLVKQMLPFKGKPIVEWVVDNAVASLLQSVVVVIGHRADLVEPVLAGKDVTVVINSDYRSGQSSSIKSGMAALPEWADAALFLLGDQPLVSPADINLLLDAYHASSAPIVLPVHKGIRGNPALFSRETFRRMELLKGDSGARALFGEYAGRILQAPVENGFIHFDIDTEEDYRRLLQSDID